MPEFHMHDIRWYACRTYVAPPTKKNVISPIFCTNLRLEAPLPVYFSCTTFRRSATTSATLLIPKCTTRRWTLRCSHYSVVKRQQFSCALSTATLPLKLENVVPEGWIMIFPVLYLRPMTMETRCSKVIFPNYSK